MSEETDMVRKSLVKMEPQFQRALPPHIPVERFSRVAITAIQTTPALLNCNKQSLFAALMKAAQDGLLPDGREAALIPYKNEVSYQPMVAGILKKVRNSGELASISPHVVYEKDSFDFWVDEQGEKLKHRPDFNGERGDVKLVYAIARTKDGSCYIEVMSKDEIEKIRSYSRAKNGPMWTNFWGEAAKKTVIKRLSKRLPMSTDLDDLLERDNEDYDFHPKPAPEMPDTTMRVKHIISAQEETTEQKDKPKEKQTAPKEIV